MNNTTRRYPRTIQQACGPHASNYITEPAPKYTWHDKLIIVSCIATVMYVIASRYF